MDDHTIRELIAGYHEQERELRAAIQDEEPGSAQQARLHGQAEGMMAARLQAEQAAGPAQPVPDLISPLGEGPPGELTPELAYEELKKHEHLGLLEYVLPSEPLGEKWVLGFQGQIITLVGMDQCAAFLVGMSVALAWAHAQIVTHDPLADLMRGRKT